MSTNQPGNAPAPSSRELRREERAERRAARHGGEWIIGLVFVAIGAVLLLQNVSGFTLTNWWALFILIPGLGALAGAWRIVTSGEGNWFAAMGPLIVGLVLTGVAVKFLFDLDWNFIDWRVAGPVLLILLGIVTLLSGAFSRR